MSLSDREVRFEMLRPGELNAEAKRSPLVFLYIFLSKYFVQGITMTGLKG